jgi:hypothetical protein
MGMSPFRNCGVYGDSPSSDNAKAPDPLQFNIHEVYAHSRYLLAIVKYPGCTNFEGTKLLVFRDMDEKTLRGLRSLDPHFERSPTSPIARFVPTPYGINAAWALVKVLEQLNIDDAGRYTNSDNKEA